MKWYIFYTHMPIYTRIYTHSRVGGRVPWGGVCVVYSDKYTDRVNIVLTTVVTVYVYMNSVTYLSHSFNNCT